MYLSKKIFYNSIYFLCQTLHLRLLSLKINVFLRYINIAYYNYTNMEIKDIVNSRIVNLETNKRIILGITSVFMVAILLILYLYSFNSYGFIALLLFSGLMIIVITAIYFSFQYFHVLQEIRYNELILEKLIED